MWSLASEHIKQVFQISWQTALSQKKDSAPGKSAESQKSKLGQN
jgi:hypothetical protein